MGSSGEMVVFEDLRSYFSTTEWNQLADGDRIICLNVMKNHLFKLSIGLTSVPPEFMARDDGGVPTRKAPFLREPNEEQKQHDAWSRHLSDAHTEPDGGKTTIPPSAKDDTAGVHSICDLCNQFYLEECEEREPPAATADAHVAVAQIQSQSGVTDARPGVFHRNVYELPGGTKEAPERDCSVRRNDHVDAKEETSVSRREDKTFRLAFAGKKTHASKQRDKTDESQSEPQATTRKPVHDVGGGKKPIRCEQCDKRFGRLSDLKRHRRVHTGERPFRCTRCVKRFIDMSHLKSHQRVHDGEKAFRCTQCDKSFGQPGGLSRHQRLLHTGKKPFGCTRCEKSFGEVGHLKRHLRVHNRERPFRCEQCDKSFSQIGHLKSHGRVHTGERPFHCTECDRSFSQVAGLGKHRLVHTGEKRSRKK